MRDVQDTQRAIDHLGDTLHGPLHVGAMEVFSSELVPRALAVLVRDSPAVVPHLYEMLPPDMAAHLSTGRLDIAFTIGGRETATVACTSLGTSRGVLVCGRTHPLYARGRVTKRDLTDHPSVVPRFFAHPELPPLDQFDDARYPRRIGATIELLQSAVALALTGRFLLYVPEISVRRHLTAGDLKPLRGLRALPAFPLQLLHRRAPTQSPAAARLTQIVRKLIRKRRPSPTGGIC